MNEKKTFISLTSDFGAQSDSVGLMEGVILSISSHVNIIHLTHELPPFNIIAAARTLEQVSFFPIGLHICICDPGVWSSRSSLILETHRGDLLLGPDNGSLIPTARNLGGIVKATAIENPEYIRTPVSHTFHGRDIYAPVAAHLSNGVSPDQFGSNIDVNDLVKAAYDEATVNDNLVDATIIQINRFGSVFLNIKYDLWKKLELDKKDSIQLRRPNTEDLHLPIGQTFSDVSEGKPLILKDDYGRAEIAVNMGSFAEIFNIKIGDSVALCI